MTRYYTGNPVGSADPRDLYDNAENLDSAINGTSPSWVDRLGRRRTSINGAIVALDNTIQKVERDAYAVISGVGYLPPIPYASGISVNNTKITVDFDGSTYAPVASKVPFVTGAEFNPDDWRLIQGVTSADLSDPNAGANLIGFGSGTVADQLRRLPVFPESYGAAGDLVTDDTEAVLAALQVCTETGRTLVLSSPGYVVNQPISYHQRRHSIIAWGRSTIDFRGVEDGQWCIQVADPSNDGSHIWDTLINEVRNVEFLGRPGIHGWRNDGPTTNIDVGSPRSAFVGCYFTDFTNTLYFGNSEWCAVFERSSFRGGGGSFITTSRTFNAGENIQFAKCIFNGANASALWNHINGPFELTFDGCSFDYCLGIMRYDPSYTTGRLIARYNSCHFEDNGSTTQFKFTLPASQTFNIELSGCDWYFTGVVPQNLAEIVSVHRSSHLIVRDCAIPIFTSQDRKLSELFKWDDTPGRFVAQGNSLQTDINSLHSIFSRKVSRYPKLNAANFKPTFGPFVFSDAASPQIVERITTGQPDGAQGDIYRSTGGSSFTCIMQHDEGRAWNISGWLYRTTGSYQLQVRFFKSDGTLIASPTVVSIPGALNAWVRFGTSQLRAPVGTVRASVSTVPVGGQTASDYNMLCDVVAEQID